VLVVYQCTRKHSPCPIPWPDIFRGTMRENREDAKMTPSSSTQVHSMPTGASLCQDRDVASSYRWNTSKQCRRDVIPPPCRAAPGAPGVALAVYARGDPCPLPGPHHSSLCTSAYARVRLTPAAWASHWPPMQLDLCTYEVDVSGASGNITSTRGREPGASLVLTDRELAPRHYRPLVVAQRAHPRHPLVGRGRELVRRRVVVRPLL